MRQLVRFISRLCKADLSGKYFVIYSSSSESNIGGEIYGDMRLRQAVSEHPVPGGRVYIVFLWDLATTQYDGAKADLLAGMEVPSVTGEMNHRTSLSGCPSMIFGVPNQCAMEAEQHHLTKYSGPG